MRIDLHAYIGHWPFRQLRRNTAEGLLGMMDQYGIDRAVVSNINGIFYKNPQSANEELAASVSRSNGRLIPFAVIDPAYTGWEYDLETCHAKLGMKGIRLYPHYHDYQVADFRCIELVKAAGRLGMPVAFSLRLVDDRQRSWLDIDRRLSTAEIASVAEQVPACRFIVLNAVVPARNDAVSRILEQTDILFDTVYASGTHMSGEYDLAAAVARYGPKKFAFGTAAPFREPVTAMLRIEASKETDAATKDLIWSGNTLRMLGETG
jgi:predicted TIM-barrel fold metal-dependent hydrolase